MKTNNVFQILSILVLFCFIGCSSPKKQYGNCDDETVYHEIAEYSYGDLVKAWGEPDRVESATVSSYNENDPSNPTTEPAKDVTWNKSKVSFNSCDFITITFKTEDSEISNGNKVQYIKCCNSKTAVGPFN